MHVGWRSLIFIGLKVESKAKVEDIGERRWVQVVKGERTRCRI